MEKRRKVEGWTLARLVTVKLKLTTYVRLLRFKEEILIKEGRNLSMDEVIAWLVAQQDKRVKYV